jgi:hypothetical protein
LRGSDAFVGKAVENKVTPTLLVAGAVTDIVFAKSLTELFSTSQRVGVGVEPAGPPMLPDASSRNTTS